METWDAIRARRHVRNYEDLPIPGPELDRILDAGRLAPSNGNAQARDFVLITDGDQLSELAEVCGGAEHVRTSAATIAFVIPDADEATVVRYAYDAGQATIPMAIAAVDLGIGSAPAELGDQDTISRVLGLPAGHRCLHVLAFGYPADEPLGPPAKIHRSAFDEVVHSGHW